MASFSLPRHAGMTVASRLGSLRTVPVVMSGVDWLWLVGLGVTAGLFSTQLDFSLRIPGHAILRAVFPMAAGLALVPRRGAGFVMGLAAGLTGLALPWFGAVSHGGGGGAFTSLVTIGPLLDFVLSWARRGWHVWLSFACAGIAANALAFIARSLTKASAAPTALSDWLAMAPLSYLACGLIAGLISGAIWFAGNRGSAQDAAAEPPHNSDAL